VIAHFDLDAFYAGVAQLDDPTLRGKPVAISGSSRRSVVLTASYEARPFGVRSAMPLYQAKERCRDLVVVPPNFQRYRELSRACFAIFADGARAVEGLSLDEAFVAVEGADLALAVAYAREVRARVRTEVGLTVSAGVASQKMVAKIACDQGKPDGLEVVEPGGEAAYLAPLAVGKLWGVGPKSQARLATAGVSTIGEFAALDDSRLFKLFGRWGSELRELARGHDTREVVADRETRSVSSETTFEYDLTDRSELLGVLRELADDVAQRMAAHGLRATTIGVKIKRADWQIVGRQTSVAEPTRDPVTILAAAERCLARAHADYAPVRLLGVRVASLTEDTVEQISLFAP
jgi:DNA polymerase IV